MLSPPAHLHLLQYYNIKHDIDMTVAFSDNINLKFTF